MILVVVEARLLKKKAKSRRSHIIGRYARGGKGKDDLQGINNILSIKR